MQIVRVRKVFRSGGSLAITLPPELCRALNISPGDEVQLSIRIDGNEATIKLSKLGKLT